MRELTEKQKEAATLLLEIGRYMGWCSGSLVGTWYNNDAKLALLDERNGKVAVAQQKLMDIILEIK